MDLTSFQEFCEDQFPFITESSRFKDDRTCPKIKPYEIFKTLFYGGALGLGSLLGIDQFLRTDAGKTLFKSTKPLVSDTTLSRSLTTMDRPRLHRLLQRLYQRGRTMGASRLPVGLERLSVGLMDGTRFGAMWACCFAQIGPICLPADLIRMEKKGKELPSATLLLKRLVTRFGYRFVDLLLLDGLYMAQDFITACLTYRIDVLIKTQEEDLLIIQDAKGLLLHPEARDFGVTIETGIDNKRQRTYNARALGGFFHKGVDAPFTVCHVTEKQIKTGHSHTFFVLTTRQDLGPNQMRLLAHERWQVENNGFKTLNHLVHSKHRYAHDPKAQEAMVLILMMAAIVLQLFDRRIDQNTFTQRFGAVKRTGRMIQLLIRQSLTGPLPDT